MKSDPSRLVPSGLARTNLGSTRMGKARGKGKVEVRGSFFFDQLPHRLVSLRPPQVAAPSPTPRILQAEDKRLCIEAIRAAGHKLTCPQIISAIEAKGHVVSKSNIKKALPDLVKNGTLTKPGRGCRAEGYGLREWQSGQ